MRVDFTLHSDFQEMKQFITTINPKYVYMVHCAEPYDISGETIEQEIVRCPDCRSQITFVEDGELYQL